MNTSEGMSVHVTSEDLTESVFKAVQTSLELIERKHYYTRANL